MDNNVLILEKEREKRLWKRGWDNILDCNTQVWEESWF